MDSLLDVQSQATRLAQRTSPCLGPTLPRQAALDKATASLPDPSSPSYLAGQDSAATALHIARDIVPGLTGQALSSRYYGFVTGGTLPVAEWADNVVSRMDQNVQVHLPRESVGTAVEDAALRMLTRVLGLTDGWTGTLTTGATGANILGLACGREAVVQGAAEMGLVRACEAAGVRDVQVLTSAGHSSLAKAAAAVGLGRRAVRDVGCEERPWRLRLGVLRGELTRDGVRSIVVVSAGDVNTGGFALDGRAEWEAVRALADEHGAWLHVDAAMGAFAAALPDEPQFEVLRQGVDGMGLADSIALDAHKLLNVPYDCGVFLTRSASILSTVFRNPNAAYLASPASDIPSPLNIGLENSRRFRALPMYAVLLSEGRPGIANMVANMVLLARRLAEFLRDSPHYELLPDEHAPIDAIFMIVLFRAVSNDLNCSIVDRINATRDMYVSGTTWRGEQAVRIAVSSWKVDVERDYAVATAILNAVAENRPYDIKSVSQ